MASLVTFFESDIIDAGQSDNALCKLRRPSTSARVRVKFLRNRIRFV